MNAYKTVDVVGMGGKYSVTSNGAVISNNYKGSKNPKIARSALITAAQVSTGASVGYVNSVINSMALNQPPKPNWFSRLIAPFAFWVKA